MPRKKQTYEQALKRLEEIAELMESSETSLETSVKLYKEGVELSSFCSRALIDAEEEISELKKNTDGSFRLLSFKASEEDSYE